MLCCAVLRQVEGHILGTAVKVVKSTAEDLAAVLDRVRQQIALTEEEGGEETDQPWVRQGVGGDQRMGGLRRGARWMASQRRSSRWLRGDNGQFAAT